MEPRSYRRDVTPENQDQRRARTAGRGRLGSDEAHTRVPNLIYDIVLWLVPPPERDCLLYIVRRTYGFADPNGGRKARDMISLDQFEKGITTGDYLQDLGINRSRNTIKKALQELEKKQLVDARYSCASCRWEQKPDHLPPKIDERSKAPACPRCGASLSRSYALATLTPRKLENLLNAHDPQGRKFEWDGNFFRVADAEAAKKERRQKEDLEAEARRLRDLLWYPELVDQAIGLAASKLKSGKVTTSRQINGFYKPIWEMQEEFANPPLIKFALEQTLKSAVFKGEKTHNWHRYALAVARNNRYRFRKAGDPEPTQPQDEKQALRERELSMRELLRRAAQLNASGDTTEARALLSDILGEVKELAPLFDGDEKRCEEQLRLAFKQGSDDFVGETVDRFSPIDYYPEWQPAEAASDAVAS